MNDFVLCVVRLPAVAADNDEDVCVSHFLPALIFQPPTAVLNLTASHTVLSVMGSKTTKLLPGLHYQCMAESRL